MIEVQRKVCGHTILKASGDTLLEVFEELSGLMEIFGIERCGLCQCSPVGYRTRTVENMSFHECFCYSCGGTLAFGQTKVGKKLFPRRKDATSGAKLPNGGWFIWNANGADNAPLAPGELPPDF